MEKLFFNPNIQNDIYLAIKFTEKKFVDKAAENFQKFFAGTRLKVVDDHYFRTSSEPIIKKLPNWIQETNQANLWAEENLVTPLTERLTNIAVNDKIIVIQSNRTISDGSFFLKAFRNVLSDTSNLEPVTEPPYKITEAFSKEIENAVNEYSKNPRKQPFDLTKYTFDPNDSYLGKPGTKRIQSQRIIHVQDLVCYDKKEQKPKHCSETQFAAFCFAMSALCNHKPTDYNPMAVSIMADARRFMLDKSRIDWRFGQCFAAPIIGAIPEQGDTVNSIINKIRESIRSKDSNFVFHDLLTMDTFFKPKPCQLYGLISSLGPIKYERPIIDFDLKNWCTTTEGYGDNGRSNGSIWQLITYSKVNEKKNDLVIFQLHDPGEHTMLRTKILLDSFEYFLTKIPLVTKYEDALIEIERFQEEIIKNY